ncbi:transcriptional regulator BetI [Hasllibacter sp. MH4015]|uniref:choline-binding transcriptional repressor BetI n=1 Tax=Hasllibacter sp. MH4015 TaxID=2854029 RepID=UPI001CD607D3|nr:transcriptional regulator BetI [Hasllibacter sp. MH4015]
MPRTGMMAIRKDALVNATISEIGRAGSLDVTVGQIAKVAGVSSALAHHYFGSKDDLLLAAMRAILREFGAAARAELSRAATPMERLEAIARASFAGPNFNPEVVSAWLTFYVMAQRDAEAARLLRVYQHRLVSNLTHALTPLTDTPGQIAQTAAALIDGLYIRHALAEIGPPDGNAAVARVMDYLNGAIA